MLKAHGSPSSRILFSWHGPGTEHREKDGEEEETVDWAKNYHQQHDLGEGVGDVTENKDQDKDQWG